MKGRNVSAKEKALHNRIAALGCIACRIDGNQNDEVSIHHIHGRTKNNAHKMVLPLCSSHHQDGSGRFKATAVHPHKARFQKEYGLQDELCAWAYELIGEDLDEWLADD
jgi:hypothetical protein